MQNSFIVHVKTNNIFKDIIEDAEQIFELLNFELDKPFSKGEDKKIIELMKCEVGGESMKEFVGLRAKLYRYLKDNNDEDKKAKGSQKCDNVT